MGMDLLGVAGADSVCTNPRGKPLRSGPRIAGMTGPPIAGRLTLRRTSAAQCPPPAVIGANSVGPGRRLRIRDVVPRQRFRFTEPTKEREKQQ